MSSVSSEIVADIAQHIRKCCGDFTAWCVGIARDGHNPVFESRQAEGKDDDLICREATRQRTINREIAQDIRAHRRKSG